MKSVDHSDSFSGPLNEARAASTAGGGTALSVTAALVALPNGTSHIALIFRNFVTAVVAKFALNPYLLMLRTDNSLAAVTDYSVQGQQPGGTGVVLNALDTLANGGAVYIGSHLPFRGLAVAMSASVNAIVSTLAVKYWNGSTWVTTTPTDGTASGGATLAQTGNVTWTVPTAWATALLHQTPGPLASVLYCDKPRYWLQVTVSVKLSTLVKANTILSLNRSTAYAEGIANSLLQFRTFKGPDGIAALELLTDAGTGSAIVNVYTDNPVGAF